MNCPDCKADVCINTALSELVRVFILASKTNQDDIEAIDETYINNQYMLNNEYPEKLRKPRKIPAKLPKPVSSGPFFLHHYFPTISVTCMKTPWVFEYVDSFIEIEFMDN